MPVPKFLVIEWPMLGTYYYSTTNLGLDPKWLANWVERLVYVNNRIAYFTNEVPENAKFRG